jgi:hypothetical protein
VKLESEDAQAFAWAFITLREWSVGLLASHRTEEDLPGKR